MPRRTHELSALEDDTVEMDGSNVTASDVQVITVDDIENGLSSGIYELCGNAGIRSNIWKCFKMIRDTNTSNMLDFVRCNRCQTVLKYKRTSGTKFLWDHERQCKIRHPQPIQSTVTLNSDQWCRQMKKDLTKSAVDMCARDMRSFEIIKGEGFRDFCQTLMDMQPGPHVREVFPSARTVSRNTTAAYKAALDELKPELTRAIEAGTVIVQFFRFLQYCFRSIESNILRIEYQLHQALDYVCVCVYACV